MKRLLKKILPRKIVQGLNKIRYTFLAFVTLPRYLKVENTNVMFPAWNWSTYLITRTGTILKDRFYYESDEIRVVKEMMKGKKKLYDVGASIGYYSYIALIQGLNHSVAFEPIKNAWRVISKAKDLQGLNIWIVPKPVGLKKQIISGTNNISDFTGEATSIDWYGLYTGHYPDIIKIDVEGGEENVIQGAIETLKRLNPDLILSLHREYLGDQRSEELLSTLRLLGYQDFSPPIGDTYFLRHQNKTIIL